jgi:hypothetical protein
VRERVRKQEIRATEFIETTEETESNRFKHKNIRSNNPCQFSSTQGLCWAVAIETMFIQSLCELGGLCGWSDLTVELVNRRQCCKLDFIAKAYMAAIGGNREEIVLRWGCPMRTRGASSPRRIVVEDFAAKCGGLVTTLRLCAFA